MKYPGYILKHNRLNNQQLRFITHPSFQYQETCPAKWNIVPQTCMLRASRPDRPQSISGFVYRAQAQVPWDDRGRFWPLKVRFTSDWSALDALGHVLLITDLKINASRWSTYEAIMYLFISPGNYGILVKDWFELSSLVLTKGTMSRKSLCPLKMSGFFEQKGY